MTKPKASHSEWIQTAKQKLSRCHMCADEARHTLVEILEAINEARAFTVSMQKIYDRVASLSKGFTSRVGYDAFRHHLSRHEPTWHRAKVASK